MFLHQIQRDIKAVSVNNVDFRWVLEHTLLSMGVVVVLVVVLFSVQSGIRHSLDLEINLSGVGQPVEPT